MIKSLENQNKTVRKYIVFSLIEIGDEKAVPGLTELFKEKTETSAEFTEKKGDEKVDQTLLKAVEEKDLNFRKEVAKTFEEIEDSETEHLINALEADPQNIKNTKRLPELILRMKKYRRNS